MAISTIGASALDSGVSQLGKNLIQNGAMTVDQRSGETRTGLGAATAYHIDQWRYTPFGSPTGRFTLSRGTGLASLGFAYSHRIEVTTLDAALAANAYYGVTHYVEAQNLQHLKYGTANALSLTLSFAIVTDTTGPFTVMIIAPDGSRSYSTTVTVASADVAEIVSVTIPGDTGGTITNDNGRGFEVIITFAGGSDYVGGTQGSWGAEANNKYAAGMSSNMFDTNGNYFEFSGVQLEVGSVARDFEYEDIGETERKCFRYQRVFAIASSDQLAGSAIQSSSTAGIALVPLSPPLRATPNSVTVSAASHFQVTEYGATVRILSALTLEAGATKDMLSLNYTNAASGLVANESSQVVSNSSSATVLVEANL